MIPIIRPSLAEEEARAAARVVMSGWVAQGPKVAEFEQSVAQYCGARYAVAASSGTTALHLALLVAGVREGDEVICPSMSFIATANVVRHCGAKPVFADVRAEDFNIDPEVIEPLITPRAKAILPVHQMGMPAEMDRICAIAKAHGLAVVEDAACALGSAVRGRKIGKPFGQSACFSFHPRKIITTGEGGMITTDDEQAADQLRLLRQHGMSISAADRHSAAKVTCESYVRVGYNYRMTDIQAAIGIEQLKRLEDIVAQRQRLAARYSQALGDLPGVRVPVVPPEVNFNYQSYALLLTAEARRSRDDVVQLLFEKGIASRRGIMTSHREPAYADLCAGLTLPVSQYASDHSLLLPLYHQMTDQEQQQVISTLHEALA